MGDERDTTAGEVVYLLAELQPAVDGPVYEIGSRARVVGADGDQLTIAIARGDREDVVTCRSVHVSRAGRSLTSRRRVLRSQTLPSLPGLPGPATFSPASS
jgi:hypothetical protein